MHRGLHCVWLILLPVAFAQNQPASAKLPTPEERWLAPAQRVTGSITSDLWRLPVWMEAIAQAQLASAWWTQDTVAARKWAGAAVDLVTQAPQNEAEADHALRLRAARIVLSLVTPLDATLRDRVESTLESNAAAPGQQSSARARASYASMMIGAAMQDKAHPEQLAGAIADALQNGLPGITFRPLLVLRDANPDEADILFRRALAMSGDGGSSDALMSLLRSIWPEPNAPRIPEPWRQSAFAEFARALSASDSTHDRQKSTCQLAGQLSNRKSELPPDLASIVTQTWSACDRPQPTPEQLADGELFKRRAPKTADDFLELASEMKLPADSMQSKLNAAMRAELDEHDPERALKICDSMTADELASRPGMIEQYRMELAIRTALHLFDNGNPQQALKVIDTSPAENAFHVAVAFLQQERKPVPQSFYDLALHAMEAQAPFDPMDFVHLLNAFVKRGDLDVVDKIIGEMDRWKEKDPKSLKPGEMFNGSPWERTLSPLPLDSQIADVDAGTVAAKFALPQNTALRTDLQLSLVRAWLARYQPAAKASAQAAGAQSPR